MGPTKLQKKGDLVYPLIGFWRRFLSRSAQNPLVPQPSEMTVAAFVEKVFVPEHVALKRLSGRTHFRSILKVRAPARRSEPDIPSRPGDVNDKA